MIDRFRNHLLSYAMGAAVGLALLRFITPTIVDPMFDALTLLLVWAVVKVAERP